MEPISAHVLLLFVNLGFHVWKGPFVLIRCILLPPYVLLTRSCFSSAVEDDKMATASKARFFFFLVQWGGACWSVVGLDELPPLVAWWSPVVRWFSGQSPIQTTNLGVPDRTKTSLVVSFKGICGRSFPHSLLSTSKFNGQQSLPHLKHV